MARRKGKSLRRIKDWTAQYHHGDFDEEPLAPRRQKVTRRAVKLPPDRVAEDQTERTEAGFEEMPKADGMVVGFYPGGAVVRVGGEELLCGIAKTFRAAEGSSALAVGDDVRVALTRQAHADASESDRDRADGMVLWRGPRKTALARPRPRSGKRRDAHDEKSFEKIIAANMDVLLVVAATRRPALRHGLIDRFLIIAERGELEPILVINKTDLGWPEGAREVLAEFETLEVAIFACSATTGEGLDALRSALAGRRSVLAGASGVGKSTLINALVPDADAATGAVRDADERGRHTTSAAVVYELPGGGMIVDTPGIRELGMALDRDELPWYFPEIEAAAPRCRFNDCTHTHEPDCAVRRAADDGEIPRRRYTSYLRILETLGE